MKTSLLFVIIIPVLLFVGLRKISASFFSVDTYKCDVSQILSSDYSACIDNALKEMIDKNISAPELIKELKIVFPVLNKIIISYLPTGMHITISAYEPVCCINDMLIMTVENMVFPKNIFSEISLVNIPTITVLQEDMINLSSCVSSLLYTLPCDFNQLYDLELIDEYFVRLIDKQDPHFIIMFMANQEKLSWLCDQCTLVKQYIVERAGFNKGVKWVADTRFADYIITYKA